MNTIRLCEICRAPLPPDSPDVVCSSCLLVKEDGESTGTEKAKRQAQTHVPPSPDELAPLFPQLEILQLIGQGGMGMVYKARQPKLDRLVALKILPAESGRDPAFAERFGREARALAKLNHPGIVAIYDFGCVDPYYYIVMEFVDGVNLHELIHGRKMKPDKALNLVMQICEALQFAHNLGIVHRDIKPGNILVSSGDRVKIADFGLAKLLGSNVEDIALTGTRHMMGTPHYMAPEQMEHPKEVDHRADIYSLGVVFYELLTGELPLGRFAPPSQKVQVDVRLDEVVLRTLEHEPERRYQQAKEVKNRVQNIADTTQRQPGDDDTDNEATETGAIASERRRVPVRRSLVIAAISILIVGLPLFLLRYRDSGKVIAIRENPPGFGHVTHDSRWCNYIIEVPANHRLNFWIEWWQDGRKSNRTDFTVSDSFAPSRGRPFSGYADLAIWTAASPPGSSNNYVKWQWGLRGSGALSGLGNMAQDPFQGMTVRDSSFGHSPSRMVKPGEIVTLVVLRGDTDFLQGDPWDPRVAGRADVEMHLKARFDALAKADLSDEPKSGPAVVR